MKACRQCGRALALGEFYAHPRMADGHLNKCKDCVRARVIRHRANNLQSVQAYDRLRGRRQERKDRQKERLLQRFGMLVFPGHAHSNKQWSERNRHKKNAHAAVSRAIKDGRLLRLPCEVCGSPAQAHHDDYSRQLEVRWLCPSHHGEVHRRYA